MGQRAADLTSRPPAVAGHFYDADPHQLRSEVELTEEFYKRLCSAQLGPVLDTLVYLKHETNVWFEITTLLIPGENDLSGWVLEQLGPDVPLHFTAFHPDWKMLDRPPTPPSTLHMARKIAQEVGLRYVFTGNTHDEAGQSRYCHHCGTRLMEVAGTNCSVAKCTPDGRCVGCGTACAGVLEGSPGAWGPRRCPVLVPV